MSEWQTPPFAQIKKRKSKRASPYSATEIWELDEVLTIVKYEPNQRNKAALMLLWDLDARNHEVTNIELRNVRLKAQYAEGEIPEGKTGSGPMLLTVSFPYVRDWLNLHPLRDYPKARLICHTSNGKSLRPDYLWTMMKQLKERIQTLLKEGHIKDEEERDRLELLIKTKKWNPYCFRHSAITHDSDYLPGYALNKKVRWSMNSKQLGRYIKNRMGDALKKTILTHNGIVAEQDNKPKATTRLCPKCSSVNALENDYCSKSGCGYPLTTRGYDEIKKNEAEKEDRIKRLEDKQAFFEDLLSDPPKLKQFLKAAS
jgi:integrase/recombinase XerD